MRTFTCTEEEQMYVLYWPEDATWDDNAVSAVQCNRVVFMRYILISSPFVPKYFTMTRYLTKLCDQLVCLLSSAHSQAIVWGNEVDDMEDASIDSSSDNDSDRLYVYKIAKTDEQEEKVVARQGFTVWYLIIHSLPVLTLIIAC